MSRDVDSGLLAHFQGIKTDPAFFFSAYFDSGTLRFWTGIGEINVTLDTLDPITGAAEGAQDFFGFGNLINISQVEETSEMRAVNATIAISGIPSEIISIALQENYQGRPARCWLGAFGPTGAMVASPFLLYQAYMDVMEIEKGGETAVVRMNVESRKRHRQEAFYTHEDQQINYSGDQFFSRMNELQDKEIILKPGGRGNSTLGPSRPIIQLG